MWTGDWGLAMGDWRCVMDTPWRFSIEGHMTPGEGDHAETRVIHTSESSYNPPVDRGVRAGSSSS